MSESKPQSAAFEELPTSAGKERKRAERHHEGGNTAEGEDRAVRETQSRSEHHRQREREYANTTGIERRYGDSASEKNHCADGQVYAAHEHDERGAKTRKQQRARLSENAGGITQRQERGGRQGEKHAQRHDDSHRQPHAGT